jgi:hypothetical protein
VDSIALSMIVKDEAEVITRCLRSVRAHIDAWYVSDTGSTDRTQKLIRRALYAIPGTLAEHPWKDFSWNRQQSLWGAQAVGCEWVLTLDADEVLEGAGPLPDGEGGFVLVTQGETGRGYRQLLARSDLPWKWVLPVHETLVLPTRKPRLRVAHGWVIRHLGDGRRHQDPQCHLRDAKVLAEYLQEHPNDRRAQRHLERAPPLDIFGPP